MQHDRIVAVNGISGDTAQIVEEMTSSKRWELVVQRPQMFRAEIDRHGAGQLGVTLQYVANGTPFATSVFRFDLRRCRALRSPAHTPRN